jgi:cellulose synthase operon protein C
LRSTSIKRLAALILSAAVLATLAGCSSESEADLIASAKTYIEKKDNKAAIIQLKAALQKQPQSPEARFLLGETLFKSGDVAAAVVELEKAHDLKYSEDEVLPVLAQALMAAGQAKKVTDLYSRVTLTDPKAAAELKAVVASAFSAQGLRERSQAATDMALGLDPANVKARLLQARHVATQGDIDKALTLVDTLLADDPKRIEAHQLKGQLLWLGKRDLPGAAQSFRAALELDPKSVPARTSLIAVFL